MNQLEEELKCQVSKGSELRIGGAYSAIAGGKTWLIKEELQELRRAVEVWRYNFAKNG